MNIQAQYEHSKFGTFMFNLCAVGTKFIVKYKGLYYLLAFTGGIILTVLGYILTLILLIACGLGNIPFKFKKYNGVYAISVGPEYGGGLEMGLIFFRDGKSSSDSLDTHEFGHTIQNTLLGPLFPILVAIPSATRGWARTINKKKSGPAYNSFGAEDSASECGKYSNGYLNKKEVNN